MVSTNKPQRKLALFIQKIDRKGKELTAIEERVKQLNDPTIGAYTVSLIPQLKQYEPLRVADYEAIRKGEEIPLHPNKFLHAYARVTGITKDSQEWQEAVQALAHDITVEHYAPILGDKIEDILAPERKREPQG